MPYRIRSTSLLLTAIMVILLTGVESFAELKDYSDKGRDFSVLKDIRLEAISVSFLEKRNIALFGEIKNVSVFTVRTREAVNFDDVVSPYNNVLKDLDLYYELMIGDDSDGAIHNSLIEGTYSVCTDAKAKQSDFDQIGLSGTPDKYVLYQGGVTTPDVVWFDGRFVHVRFLKFSERRRDRVPTTETFWDKKIGLFKAAEKLPLHKMKKDDKNGFLVAYSAGKFKLASGKK